MAGRGIGRIGQQVGAGGVLGVAEFRIAGRRPIDEPAVAVGVGIDRDVRGRCLLTDDAAGQIRDAESRGMQRCKFACRGSRRRPRRDRRGDHGVQFRHGQMHLARGRLRRLHAARGSEQKLGTPEISATRSLGWISEGKYRDCAVCGVGDGVIAVHVGLDR